MEEYRALTDITKLIASLKWGSIEIQVQDGQIVQVTKREVFKMKKEEGKKDTPQSKD